MFVSRNLVFVQHAHGGTLIVLKLVGSHAPDKGYQECRSYQNAGEDQYV